MKNDFGRYLLYDDNYRAGCGLCGWWPAFATLYGFLDGGSLNVRKYSFYVNFQSSGSSTFPQHKKDSLSFSMHIQAKHYECLILLHTIWSEEKRKKREKMAVWRAHRILLASVSPSFSTNKKQKQCAFAVFLANQTSNKKYSYSKSFRAITRLWCVDRQNSISY